MDNSDTYLGDGLYASFDGYQFRLYASDGRRVTNEVFLEPQVMNAFFRYVERTENIQIKLERNTVEVSKDQT